ncbi:hypothetical protein HDU93_006323 [Gonapodya sp. JEL0774]|nr:hypothetical protein HDU93_006323 [Gonapodya sp. JEL0774]
MAAAWKDLDLIAAVEANSLALVRKALTEGADPNARKRITLTTKIKEGGTKTDSVLGECALVLAVIHGSAYIVASLIQAGADPCRPVEWKISTWSSSWDLNEWNNTCWLRTYTYPSTLALALTRGGKVTTYNGRVSTDWGPDTEKGKVQMNKKGGDVRLDNPASHAARLDEMTYTPRIEVVAVLLRSAIGAINADLLTQARTLSDPQFAELIEKPLEADYDTAEAVVTSRGGTNDLKAEVEALTAQLEQLTTRFLSDTDRLQQQVKDLQGRNADLQSKLQNAERQTQSIVATLSTRLDQTTSVSTRLEQTTSQLNTRLDQTTSQMNENTSQLTQLTQSNTQTSACVARLEQQVASLRDLEPTSNHAQAAPIDVKRMMYVVADFTPSDPDEIAVSREGSSQQGLNTTTNASGFFPMACLADTPTPNPITVSVAARTSSIVAPLRTPPPSNPFVARAVPSTRAFNDVRGPIP